MRIVAAHAGELASRSPPLRRSLDRVPPYRVSPPDADVSLMTTDAELVYRIVKYRFVIRRMRIVTGHAPLRPVENAVSEARPVSLYQTFHIAVAGDTEIGRPPCPELISVLVAMGVVTESAAAGDHRAMDAFSRAPILFSGVAGDAGLLDLSRRKPDAKRLRELLMACEALLVDRRAVLPWRLFEKVAMAARARFLRPKTDRLHGGGFLQIVALGADVGELAVSVKEIDVAPQGIRIQGGAHGTVIDYQPLRAGVNGKAVQVWLKGESEVEIIIVQNFPDHRRVDPPFVRLHPDLGAFPVWPAHHEVSLRMPADDRCAGRWGQNLDTGGESQVSGRDALQPKLAQKDQKKAEDGPGRS